MSTAEERAKRRAIAKRHQARNVARGICSSCGVEPLVTKVLCIRCRDRARACAKRIKEEAREEAFARYGGAHCACCGETERGFLTVDHVHSDGAEMRRASHYHKNIFPWLKAHGFPEGFQILCYNCNCGRARNGGKCPHENNR